MFCTKCGSQIAPGNKFCTVCGNPVSADAEDAPGKPRFLDEPESIPEKSPESVPEESSDETYASPKIESKKSPVRLKRSCQAVKLQL